MSEFNIEVKGGSSVRLPTAGKYCDRDIVVTAGNSEIENEFVKIISRVGSQPVKLPDSITDIGGYAFYNFSDLELTSLPNSVTSIGTNAFYGCSKLALTSLPSGLTRIAMNAFYLCNLLITSIPSSVDTIGASAFYGCDFTKITFEGTPRSLLHHNAFNGCNYLTTINVPWSEGEIDGAPWGARKATINYNYKGG